MDLSLGSAVTTLQPGQPLRLDGASGKRLTCVQGAVWITQDGDLRDSLLTAGSDYRFARDGVAVVQALGEPALLSCEEGLGQAPARGLRAYLRAVWAGLQAKWRMQRARRALAGLSDRELRDIGIRRGQIDLLAL